jgi:DNA-binding transcriptional MocR family regulator
MPQRRLDPGFQARCRARGVDISPGRLYFTDGRRSSSFRFNYASHTPERIEEGVRRLAGCIDEEPSP